MIRFFFVLLILVQPLISFTQKKFVRDTLLPGVIKFEDSVYKIKQNPVVLAKHFSQNPVLDLISDPLQHLDNIGFRFIIRELDMYYSKPGHQTDSVQEAVNTLLQYVKNDSIRDMVFYLKEYIENRKTEHALRELKKQIELEEVLSYQPDLYVVDEVEDNNALELEALNRLYNYVENDPVHQWIREISRDSVFIGVKNYLNDSINFWFNNGKRDFKRFWLKKNKRDSIGIWVQNTNNRSIRILVDDDVYQESVQKSKVRGVRVKLEKKVSEDQYKLANLRKYKRYRQIWSSGATIGLSFNQGHVSESWAGGGESSFATLSAINAFANYKKGNQSWENALEIKYGLLKSGDNGFRKNEDMIELTTKYGQKAVNKWYYSVLFNFKTQMQKGYDYSDDAPRKLKSDFFAPAYIIASLGMDYKPDQNFSVLVSPIATKYTIVRNTVEIDQTAYGLDEGKKVKKEAGAYVNIYHKFKFWEDMKMENKLVMYSNYFDKPGNVDIDWEFILTMPINQYLSAKLSTNLISDDDTDSKIQFKETLQVGVSYVF